MRLLGLRPIHDAAAGAGGPHRGAPRPKVLPPRDLDWADLRDYRDYLVHHLDDPAQVTGYQDQGVTAAD